MPQDNARPVLASFEMKKFRFLLTLQVLLAGVAHAAEDGYTLPACQEMEGKAPAEQTLQCYKQVAQAQHEAKETEAALSVRPAGGRTLAEEWAPVDGRPLKPYKQIYFLFTHTDNPNDAPTSPNPQNQVPFAYALDHKEVKFQISIKSALMAITERQTLWAGYSQQSFWQVFDARHSNPFRETNYEPELIYSYRPRNKKLAGLDWIFLNGAITHHSNGQSLPRSRTFSKAYVQFGLERNFGDDGRLAILPRYWKRSGGGGTDDDNPDILNYYGHGEVEMRYYYKHGMLAAIARSRSLQLDLSLPPWLFGIEKIKNADLHLQYFHGYGESLIDYNQSHTTWGIGISMPFEDSL